MLTALERGVKGSKWFSLVDKVYALPNLRAGYSKVKSNGGAAGVDHQTIEMFGCYLEENLGKLSRMLKEGTYRPQAIKRVWIPKPGSEAATGNPDGTRPGGASRAAGRAGTDL
jgi:RNA-directed DNA polymerase